MWPDRVYPGLLTYESGALPTGLHGPAFIKDKMVLQSILLAAWAVQFFSWYSSCSHLVANISNIGDISKFVNYNHSGIIYFATCPFNSDCQLRQPTAVSVRLTVINT